jgi:ribosomal protein L3 glutamine methyltransferase
MIADAAAELHTIIDLIRYGASRFSAAGLTFGHSYDNALDEATQLVLHALHLPHDLGPAYGPRACCRPSASCWPVRAPHRRAQAGRLPHRRGLVRRAELQERRARVPRSPIAELIETGFEPWLAGRPVSRALDLCTGSGCIAIAMAHYNPNWEVDAVDISDDALRWRPRTRSGCWRQRRADQVRPVRRPDGRATT